jgi:CcmD family protein
MQNPDLSRGERSEDIMQGFGYLVAAYAVVWVGLFVYLAVVMLRIRGVRTELVAVEELVREQQ